MVVARKRELTYPVTPEWKARVRDELRERDRVAGRSRGAAADLCREISCSSGQLSELLAPESRYSHLVPRIHRAFGWDPPAPPLPGSKDVNEITYLVERLNQADRDLVAAAVDTLRGDAGEDAKQALVAMLKVLRK